MIHIQGLTKDYGKGRGVFDLSFQVQEGEAFGYLGPNGSGKTTTIRHLLGFLNADVGALSIGGLDCRKEAAKIHETLGYLPGEIAFFEQMKGNEYLRFVSHLRKNRQAPRQKELLERFELDPNARIKRMSKGMKQKLALVAAFMHDPQVLILDEPTSGLDPLMQSAFVDLIHQERRQGKTILMSSHSFEEIEKTCSRAGILKEGRLRATVLVEDLRGQRRLLYLVDFKTQEDRDAFLREEGFGVSPVSTTQARVELEGSIAGFLAALHRHPVTGLSTLSQSLEDVFISYYGTGREQA